MPDRDQETPVQISVIVPTLNESGNVRELVEGVLAACSKAGLSPEIIVVDDGSTDGTREIIEEMGRSLPVRLLPRAAKTGITSAVLDGFSIARSRILGCMDADLSHPPEVVPLLLEPILEGEADMAVGSRYMPGGGVSEWPLRRQLISRTAGWLSRPLTEVRDPMSGFFFLRREILSGSILNPRGWKICLEILVKASPGRVIEVPYTFANRAEGSSKMGVGTIGGFLHNLVDLYAFRYFRSSASRFLRFCVVGGIGTFLNLAILAALVEYLRLWYLPAATLTFFIVALNNYVWNKLWTFGDRQGGAWMITSQIAKFILASLVALGVNLAVLGVLVEFVGLWYLSAQFIAVIVAALINFGLSARWVFSGRPLP